MGIEERRLYEERVRAAMGVIFPAVGMAVGLMAVSVVLIKLLGGINRDAGIGAVVTVIKGL